MSYAIISLGGKQYRVQPGERLLVDRVKTEAGKTFQPTVLLVGGDGKDVDLKPKTAVTARVVEHVLGDKVRIGKYRPKKGFKKHTGFRASLTRIEIEAIGSSKPAAPKKAEEPKAAATPEAQAEPKPTKAEVAGAVPEGYAKLTVAQIAELAPTWDRLTLEAALAYEGEHGKRKGATAALESAIAAQKEGEH